MTEDTNMQTSGAGAPVTTDSARARGSRAQHESGGCLDRARCAGVRSDDGAGGKASVT